MNNKQVGLMITSFAAILGLVIFFFNRALSQIVSTSCDHGPTCPMWGSIRFHTNISLALTVVILLIGLYFVFFGGVNQIQNSKTGIKTESKSSKKAKKTTESVILEIPEDLNPDEKQVLTVVVEEDGTIFQSAIVEKTQLSKVKITRILDKLEGKGLIERKRRGMTNVVILKR